jgi:transposase
MSSLMTDNKGHYYALPGGTRLHEFEIVSVLGSGGFGITYKRCSSAHFRFRRSWPGNGGDEGDAATMIPVPSGVRVWIATGHTDMRRGMNGLALQVQQALKRDPHAGDLFVFRGRRGNLVKVLWHDTLGMSLYAKRLERGKFVWPFPADDGPRK